MIPEKKVYFTIAFWMILFTLFIFAIILPLFKAIRNNTESLLVAKKDIASLNAELVNLEVVSKQYEEYSPNLEKINNLFIDPKIPIVFWDFLEELANKSGVFISKSGKSQTTESKLWIPFDVQINLTGSYPNFSKFLDKLENSNYLAEVREITITSIFFESGEQGISAVMKIRVFARQ